MPITPEEIRHLAHLSRLKLDEEDVAAYAKDLDAIVGYVDKLQDLDTKDVPEMEHVEDLVNVWREDVVGGCDPDARTRMIAAFPRHSGDLLEVDAVFADKTD
ncbi:Asp-tRNA(Asn)/Glu-tRNA(Gln) amidotransferase subunit GatC [Patescibacteria group bacterium]|nr:MAG: Asp-tRNA(Asn)/Glu-tRNA(Gln) amidotransferase subunit GatC [Patescibacteria group bacterium]